MYYPCTTCWNRFDRDYTPECDDKCDYARTARENKLIRKRIRELYSDEKLQELDKWIKEHFNETILSGC